ncbi:immunity protein Imm33 domain-containing protein [Rhizobium gallicum]
MLSVYENLRTGAAPVNGLRHAKSGKLTGWYIWAGEYSDAEGFFDVVR